MRLWMSAGATVVLVAIVAFSQYQQSNQPEASATVPTEPEALATGECSVANASGSSNDLVEVVNVEAELGPPAPLPPQPLPFVRFDEPPYANDLPTPTDVNVVQVEFVEPASMPRNSETQSVDGVPLGSAEDRY